MSVAPNTPFTNIIKRAGGGAGSWMVFNGHQFPNVVRDADAEDRAGRQGVAMQDVSPMMKYLVKGQEAGSFLDKISTRKLSVLREGRVAYFLMADDQGRVRDDGTAYRLEAEEFLIQSGTDLSGWMNRHKEGFDLEIASVQTSWAEMSVFGLKSAGFLKAAGIAGLEQLKPFNFMKTAYRGTELFVSRTGFTGGLGYELLIPWDRAELVLQSLVDSPRGSEITFVGNHTGVTLRLDVGFLIPSWDFPVPRDGDASDPAEYRSPYDMGWDWLVELDNREDFIGKRALIEIKRRGATHQFLAVVYDGATDPDGMAGARLFNNENEDIGRIFFGGYSATVGKFVGLSNVLAGRGRDGDRVRVGPAKAAAVLRKMPLFVFEERTQTPPPGL